MSEVSQRRCVEMSKQTKDSEGGCGPKLSLLDKSLKSSVGPSFMIKGGLPWRPVLLSFFLFTVGACFIYLGAALLMASKLADSVPSLLLGVFCIIPGAYYSFSILQIWRGAPGYSFEQLDIS